MHAGGRRTPAHVVDGGRKIASAHPNALIWGARGSDTEADVRALMVVLAKTMVTNVAIPTLVTMLYVFLIHRPYISPVHALLIKIARNPTLRTQYGTGGIISIKKPAFNNKNTCCTCRPTIQLYMYPCRIIPLF